MKARHMRPLVAGIMLGWTLAPHAAAQALAQAPLQEPAQAKPLAPAQPGDSTRAWLASLQGAPWADEAHLLQALRTRPAWLSAVSGQAAQAAQSQATAAGSQEWSTDLSMSRRHSQDAAQRRSNEWELAAQKPWRSPTQARAADQLAQAQRDVAQQNLNRQWRDLTLVLVQDLADWMQAQAQSRAWQLQLDTVTSLAQAATRRAQTGEGTELEGRQAEAAVLQARLQATLAMQKLHGQRTRLHTRWPQWPWLPTQPLSVQGDACGASLAAAAATWAERIGEHAPEVAAAQALAREAAAQAATDEAQKTPEPTVGLKGGQAFSGAERYIGVTLSLPWGGPARTAQAQASAWRLVQAQQALDEARLNAQAQAFDAVSQWQAACTQWQMETQSLSIQEQLAQSLARGHSLGEGSLQSVLLAQASVQDMRLRAQAAQAQAWLAWSRLLIGAGELWPASSMLQAGLATSLP
jgi:cobalt-zinc-cadmium efflux system outer membrane protein